MRNPHLTIIFLSNEQHCCIEEILFLRGFCTDLKNRKQFQLSNKALCKESYKSAPDLWAISVLQHFCVLQHRTCKRVYSRTGSNKWAFPSSTSQRAGALQGATFHLLDSVNHLQDQRLALQLICFLTSPNTEGSLRRCKNLNTTCSGKESLRKFAEANLLIIF